MIGLLQRVAHAEVAVDGEVVGRIAGGLLVLVAVQPADTTADADRLADRLVRYRVFADESGRMNLSLLDTGGGLLLVPQFTLAADTRKGLRPSFTDAASPEHGRTLFERVAATARGLIGESHVATGRFGAHMRVSLVNDGPVTFWLETGGRSGTGAPSRE